MNIYHCKVCGNEMMIMSKVYVTRPASNLNLSKTGLRSADIKVCYADHGSIIQAWCPDHGTMFRQLKMSDPIEDVENPITHTQWLDR